ncbi:type IX secretion system membrane protein PorP/SprF [Lewinella sp. W8]|nr:type IX secretion system membrane protein PorP/SprF [Lewinella sp. W8]
MHFLNIPRQLLNMLFPRLALVACVTTFMLSGLSGQDFHYSQFYNNPLHLNPALTGIFGGDVRMMGNYKSQWADVPVDYKTVTLAYDRKFLNVTKDNGFFSAGGAFNYDRAGDSRFTWANLDLNGSYTRILSSQIAVSVGAKAALIQRSFADDNLRFDAQFDPDAGIFDPTRSNLEDLGNDSNLFPDFSVGINLRLQAKQTSDIVYKNDRRTRLDLGVALHHIFAPDQAFFDLESVPLERRLSPYAIGVLQVLPRVDVVGAITYQNQGAFYDEFVGTLGGRVWIKNSVAKQVSLMAGMGLRRDSNQDAYWPTFEISYNNWKVGLNYDFNTSEFDIATENRGGMELSVQYIIRKVKPLPEFKICPLI